MTCLRSFETVNGDMMCLILFDSVHGSFGDDSALFLGLHFSRGSLDKMLKAACPFPWVDTIYLKGTNLLERPVEQIIEQAGLHSTLPTWAH